MLLALDKHSGVPLFRQLVEQVKKLILSGQLKEGQQITSVKQLSQELELNPMTVSKSYSLLEMEGFLERKKGIGLFVTRPRADLTERAKLALIEEAIGKVVMQAIQLNVPEKRVIELCAKVFANWRSRKDGR